MKNNIVILILLLISTYSNAKVTATVDRNQIVIGETFNLTISIDENSNEQPDLSELNKSFRVIGSNQSTSTQIINNSYSTEKKWDISLMSLGVGTAIIPAIKLGNQTTQPITITTAKSDPNAKANGDIFIEVSADKDSAFVKEQIVINIKLFYSISLSEGSLSEPIASNAIMTQLDKGSTYRTQRDGKTYEVIERHYAMFAEKSGTLDVNPVIFNGRDNTSRRSFSMFSTGKPVRAVSKPMSFEIKPIPQSSIGKDWLPATQISVSQQWSKEPFKVGEPITRTITLYIEGLSDTQIPDIDLGEIDNIRVYPEQPQTQTEKTPQTIKSWKQVKLALIPSQSGAVRIPEYQLEWYNTKTNQIETAKLPPVTLQVEAGLFEITKPEMPTNNKTDNTVTNDTVTEADENSSQPVEIKVVEKDGLIWKITTAIFALFWLVTLFVFLKLKKSKKAKVNKKAKVKISKDKIFDAIKANKPFALQNELLLWWQKKYPKHSVTNLSEMKQYVSQELNALIDDMTVGLYGKGVEYKIDQAQWQLQIKKLTMQKKQNQKSVDQTSIPKLYN